jgi:amino acid adenylation domain-containing protein
MLNDTQTGYPLSQQQKRVWLQQAHRTPFGAWCAVRLDGRLDSVRLQDALQRVMARHEILRTAFQRQAGVPLPFQVIQESASWRWRFAGPPSNGAAGQRPWDVFNDSPAAEFDLGKGLVAHALLTCIGTDRHELVLHLPALMADLRSLQILVAELGALYGTSTRAEDAEDALQYADFVEWQNELLNGEETRAGREFWRDYCRTLRLTDATGLPFETRMADEGHAAWIGSALEPGLLALADAFCRQQKISLAECLAATWALCVSRLTGQHEFTLGHDFDGRKYGELETALGPFSKTLPLQVTVLPDEPYREWINRARVDIAEIHHWEESFGGSSAETADTDVAGFELPLQFTYSELPQKAQYGGVSFELVRQEVLAERFTLKLDVERSACGVQLRFRYDAARLPREAVARWAGYFQTLLAAALREPETAVSRLPLLAEAERRQLLSEWNQTGAEYPQQCLQQLFEAQAARTPERPALRFAEQVLSYRQLNERANQLAHHLRALGVGPDALVGLAVERGAEMMLALLAILKAGGAYVPLNPDNPKARLAQQLSGAVVLIAEHSRLAQLPECAARILCLDRDQALWAQEPITNPAPNTTPENLVYVIYTSGSTGVPKGVAVRHRNLVNYTHFIMQRLELGRFPEGLHFATVSTIGADLGNTCIFPSLLSGGCLHIIRYEDSTDSQRFARYAQQHPLDVLKIVPSHLQALLSGAEGKDLLPRQFLILGGETLTRALLEKIAALGPSCQILNHYGPTETTVGSLTMKLSDYDWRNSPLTSVPIGRPIANTQIYILDQHRQPVPLGVIGELYIAGAGVSAGYLNQPQKTAERFLANPFSEDPTATMYRTGDLVRYSPAGEVEFLGRGDDQVKIRGFRIELGEIESVLLQHPAVKQALVLAREDARGEKQLVAYVVRQREPAATPEALREWLKQQLPDYMVPAALLPLAKIPLTPNGKIDRDALPTPEQAQAQSHVYLAPCTPTEIAVASIWSDVLRRERISLHDNFFDLGGHSLMATQIVSRIREHFHVELAMRTLFERPTIHGVSQAVEASQPVEEELDSVILPVSRSAYRAGRT